MAGENSSQLTPNDHRMATANQRARDLPPPPQVDPKRGREGCVVAAATHNGSDVTGQCHMTAVEGYIFYLSWFHFAVEKDVKNPRKPAGFVQETLPPNTPTSPTPPDVRNGDGINSCCLWISFRNGSCGTRRGAASGCGMRAGVRWRLYVTHTFFSRAIQAAIPLSRQTDFKRFGRSGELH